MTLKLKSFSAIRWTATAAATRVLLRMAQLGILARILAPEDFGLMAIVGVILSFSELFADLGVNSAFVQRQQITHEQRSSLFWFNVLLSTILAAVVIAASPMLGWFFGDARLTALVMLSTVTLVVNALGNQIRMAAEKNLDFRPVVTQEIFANILGFVAALFAALADWGVYSLLVSAIVSATVATALAWLFISHGWRPMWRLRMDDLRPFLWFGSVVVADGIVNNINRTIDIFVGGRFLTATQLGLYSIPRNISLQLQFMINPIITRVGFPLIAQAQSDLALVRSIYLKTMNMTASTNAPLHVGIAFFASEIVTILLGSGWGPSADILRILAIWGGLRSVGNPVGSLMEGMGRPDLGLRWNLAMLLVVPPCIWLGSQNGPQGIAWALLGLQVIFFIPAWYVLVRPLCQISLLNYSTVALKPFVLAALAIAPGYWVASHFDGAMIRLIAGSTLAVPLYLGLSYRLNQEWFSAMMQLFGRKGIPAP